MMSTRALLTPILENEHVTRGLDDSAARILVEWLVERAEIEIAKSRHEKRVKAEVQCLCLRARAIARFVTLWCHDRSPSAALQLAATERFAWPLPIDAIDACDLLSDILAWEDTPADERPTDE